MPLPFAEAAKGTQSKISPLIARIINQVSPVSEYISIRETDGSRTLTWFTEKDLGTNTWTAINENPPASSTSEINEFVVAVSRLSRFMQVDKGLAKIPRKGLDLKAREISAAGRSYGLDFTEVFFNGSVTVNPKQPNGVKAIIDAQIANGTMPSQQKLDAGAGGAPLTLALMQDLQSRVWPDDNGAFFMNRDMFLYFQSLIRDASAAGYYRIEEDRTMFGKPITTFNGWPIRIVMRTDNYSTALPFTEANSTTSIYAVTFEADMGIFGVADGGVGLTAGPFVDLQIDNFVKSFTMHEYSFASGGPRSVARLFDLSNPNS